ncbi:pentapeptide repeat-containing protein [Candidatus Entotheonella palauensis]|uniref:pentapeptide repeat-containing protein n=1 Tax=Candidatus Entotheonella palauensis TaxID=93172 RepID=UPI000B7CE9A0|nr:pentapeptide repeat-containing protein [Candidatus Entotheonella palauensis]
MGFLVGLLIVAAVTTAHGTTDCTGPYRGGGKPDAEDLVQVLAAHAAWQRDAAAAYAVRANLCGADLRGTRLTQQNLAGSNLQGAMLSRAYLGGADLRGANLQQADLTAALLGHANLQGANLRQASLQKAYLVDANLQRAMLRGANLQSAILTSTDFGQADLEGADLRQANMKHANLRQVRLGRANLQEANLWDADLSQAVLAATNLSGANLSYAELTAAVFEPPVGALPSISRLAEAQNLSQLTFRTSPYAFIAVREAFQRAGLHQQAWAVTYALNRGLRQQAPIIEQAFSLIFFELTHQYGMSPLRPLLILGLLIPGFAVPHIIMLWCCRRHISATRPWWWWQGTVCPGWGLP